MHLQTINNQIITAGKAPLSGNTPNISTGNFAQQLEQIAVSRQKTDSQNNTPLINTDKVPADIKLGTLTARTQTVAQLLLANKDLRADTWAIIHKPINANKAFRQIPLGQEIYYNRQTQALSWAAQGDLFHREAPQSLSVAKSSSASSETILLGKINHKRPTVSALFADHQQLKTQRWAIIHDAINQQKAFTRIPGGTDIYFNPGTREISWHGARDKQLNKTIVSSEVQNVPAKNLDDAVKPFMGTDYKDIDCYTLVVNGLEKMGVRYRGEDSLSRQLLHMARVEGRAMNAYFTGEGITKAMGEKIYSRAISQVDNIGQQSQKIFQEMQSLIKKGDLLSFSLETKGHTGIISQSEQQWTYINSGRLDHAIRKNAPRHGVGEENLLSEINNWLKLAHKHNESLKITIGRLDTQKFISSA